MKKVLLATTALAGVSLLATAAQAQDFVSDGQQGTAPVVQSQPAYAVRIAGTLRFDMAWVDQDKDNNVDEPGYSQWTGKHDVSIIGSATADNGLSYGFELRRRCRRPFTIHLENRLGRLDMGNTFMAQDALDVGGRSVMVGRGHFDGGGNKNVSVTIDGIMPWLCRPVETGGFSDGVIRYTTPNYGGLTIAVSYCEEADGNMTDGDSVEDIWSVGGQYTSSYGNYTTVVSAGYSQGNSATGDNDDIWVWSVGAKVTGMGAGFGISYGEKWVDQDVFAAAIPDQDVKWFDIGASFSSGPWSLSGGAVWSVEDNDIGIGPGFEVQEQVAYSLSANYNLAPGLAIMGGITVWDVENAQVGTTTVDHDATTFTLSTQASF